MYDSRVIYHPQQKEHSSKTNDCVKLPAIYACHANFTFYAKFWGPIRCDPDFPHRFCLRKPHLSARAAKIMGKILSLIMIAGFEISILRFLSDNRHKIRAHNRIKDLNMDANCDRGLIQLVILWHRRFKRI